MKVLLISHNPITTYQNMGKTLYSLFFSFRPEELCQFYIYPSLPDVPQCGAYYRITDKAVLKSYLTLRARGEEVTPALGMSTLFENEADEPLYSNPKNKTPLRMLLRDGMWKCARWYTRGLRDFIEREKPNVLFVAPGAAKFLYDVALRVARDYRLPIVTYIGDDFYFVKRPATLLGRWHSSALKKKIARLLTASRHNVVICQALKEQYEGAFGTPCDVVMTGTSQPIAAVPRVTERPTTITYMGNICCNRYHSLLAIGQALDRLNEANGTAFTLAIYTAERAEEMLSPLREIKSIRLCGFVSGKAYARVFADATLFLHTEAFDEESIDLVRHSVSTKIADSLASGVPLLAYGPREVASMRHLLDGDCALCATAPAELEGMLHRAFFDTEACRRVAENGLALAHRYHDRDENSRRIHRLMEEVADENSAN